MPSRPRSSALDRNLQLYPWYAACYNAFFWMPVFFLYFSAHLPLNRVLWLESIYYAAVVALEVPSGYCSDALGRRTTLLISSLCLLAAYVLFFVGGNFSQFAVAQVGLAAGIAFHSGTGASFLYDSLAAADAEDEYEERESIVARNALVATGGAALIGGLAASFELRWAYGLSALAALATLGLALSFREPNVHSDDDALRFDRQLKACLGHLARPALLWLFAFAVVMTMLNHVPYEFYQPYLDQLGTQWGLDDRTALATGLHMSATTMLGAWVARRSIDLDDAIGTGPTLLVATALQTAVIAIMGTLLHAVVAAVILLRALPKGIARAPMRAAIIPRIPERQRATYWSIQSLVGRLGFSGLLWGLGHLAGSTSPESWPTLSTLLQIGAGLGGVSLIVLVIGLAAVELDFPHDTDDAEGP
jgi:MFS family permease